MQVVRSTIFTGLVAASLGLAAGAAMAADPVCGDVNRSTTVTSSDALLVLKKAVGQQVTLQCLAPGLLLQTGQVTCWDPTDFNDPPATMDCAGSGQDGDAPHGLASGYVDNGDGTISDTKTGLVWEKLDNDDLKGVEGIHDWDNFYSWGDALGKIGLLNKIKLANHDDWRLPNIKELETLKNFSGTNAAVDPAFDTNCEAACLADKCSCTQADGYWSSTSYQYDATFAWYVNFYGGYTNTEGKGVGYYVRAVRGGL